MIKKMESKRKEKVDDKKDGIEKKRKKQKVKMMELKRKEKKIEDKKDLIERKEKIDDTKRWN